MSEVIELIPIEKIRVVNPRHRDPKKFETVINSIRKVGLKMPIQVSRRQATENDPA